MSNTCESCEKRKILFKTHKEYVVKDDQFSRWTTYVDRCEHSPATRYLAKYWWLLCGRLRKILGREILPLEEIQFITADNETTKAMRILALTASPEAAAEFIAEVMWREHEKIQNSSS